MKMGARKACAVWRRRRSRAGEVMRQEDFIAVRETVPEQPVNKAFLDEKKKTEGGGVCEGGEKREIGRAHV